MDLTLSAKPFKRNLKNRYNLVQADKEVLPPVFLKYLTTFLDSSCSCMIEK